MICSWCYTPIIIGEHGSLCRDCSKEISRQSDLVLPNPRIEAKKLFKQCWGRAHDEGESPQYLVRVCSDEKITDYQKSRIITVAKENEFSISADLMGERFGVDKLTIRKTLMAAGLWDQYLEAQKK